MALVLNNLKSADMPLNKETKTSGVYNVWEAECAGWGDKPFCSITSYFVGGTTNGGDNGPYRGLVGGDFRLAI